MVVETQIHNQSFSLQGSKIEIKRQKSCFLNLRPVDGRLKASCEEKSGW